MNRKEARQLVLATMEDTGSYALIVAGAPEAFDAQSPVCVVTSRSLELHNIARGEPAQTNAPVRSMLTATSEIQVSIYVRSDRGQETASEDLLDDLVDTAMYALYDTGVFTIDRSDAAPQGAPLRDIDGTMYRVERIPLRIDHDS